MKPKCQLLVKIGLTFLLLIASNITTADYDPVTTDPVLVDRDYPPTMLPVSIESTGSNLNGIVYLAQGVGPHPLLILMHGFPGNERNLDLAHALRRAGINVMFFHYRGAWGSEGNFSLSNSIDDVAAATNYVRRKAATLRTNPTGIALAGHSMGGFITLMATARDPRIECAVSIAGANLGLIGKRARIDETMAKNFAVRIDAQTGPLTGITGNTMLAELTENADLFDLTNAIPQLADRSLLLVGAYHDEAIDVAQHHTALLTGLREAGSKTVTEVIFDTDHGFSSKRMGLAKAMIAWLQQRCFIDN